MNDVQTTPAVKPENAPVTGLSAAARGDLVIGIFMLVLSALLVIGTLNMEVIGDGGLLGPQGAGWLVAGLAGLLGLILVIAALTGKSRATATTVERINVISVLWVVGGLLVFTALVEVMGWLIMATVLFAAVAIGLGNRRILQSIAVGFIMSSIIQILFSGFLEISLPSGVLGGLF